VTLNISEWHFVSPYPHFIILFQNSCSQYVYYHIFRDFYVGHISLSLVFVYNGRSATVKEPLCVASSKSLKEKLRTIVQHSTTK